MIDFIILGFLMKQKMSGYDIKQFMSISTSHFFDTSYGSIYPSLKSMEGKGWIESIEEVEGGKYRKIYSILEPGKKAFLEWLELPIEYCNGKGNQLIKIFFYRYLPRENAKALIRQFIDKVKSIKKDIEGLEPVISPLADEFQLSTHRYGKDFYQFLIGWYENFLKENINDK